MASYFNADYYFAAKAKQLSNIPGGKTYTAAEVKTEFAKLGISAEDHYKAYGQSENLNPNAYFNEAEYLATKLASLQENAATKAEWTGKTVAQLKTELAKSGLSAAEHYEQFGAFETRADGTLLNPSNAFDANAFFSAKLAQLQDAGYDGADKMTVQDVVNALKGAGLSPVSHFQSYGAAESKTDGVSMVQTVPVGQRVANDANRAALGELVPGNYNQPSKGPASAVAGEVTKPADMGGLSADAPKQPSAPVKTPADAGFVAPPDGLLDTADTTVIPPTGHTGTGPNNSFIIVGSDGKGTVVNKDGKVQGTIDKVETDANGNYKQPPVDVVIKDESGKNTNDKPADDNDQPVPPQPDPTPEPDPTPPVTPAVLKVVYTENTATLTLDKTSDVAVTAGTDAEGKTVLELTPTSGVKTTLKTGVTKVVTESNTTLTGKGDVLNNIALTGAGKLNLAETTVSGSLSINATGLSGTVNAIFKENISGGDSNVLTYSGGTGVDTLTLKAQDANGDYSNLKLVAALGSGDDVINLGIGQDGISFADGSTLDGGDGNDTLKITGAATASGTLKFHEDGSLVGIEKIDLSAVTVGDHSIGINLSNQAEKFTVIGSAGSDSIVGGKAADTIMGGTGGADFLTGSSNSPAGSGADTIDTDTIFAGLQSEKTGDVYAESVKTTAPTGYNAKFLEIFNNGKDSQAWLSTTALNQFKDATILEGREGDDTLIASNQKDVFLFQTGGGENGSTKETTVKALGKDTIHAFNVTKDAAAKDIIFFMDQSSKTDTNGDDSYSAGWTWTKKEAAVVTADGDITSTAAVSGAGPVSGDVSVKFNVDAKKATITISGDVIVGDVAGDLVIELVGVQGLTADTTVADFFGGTLPTA